jgi:hypothetical protein
MVAKFPFPTEPTAYVALDTVEKMLVRMTARIFVGFPLCRNEEWIRTAKEYVDSVLKTMIALRCYPDWTKPILAVFHPATWESARTVKIANRLVGDDVLARQRKGKEGSDEELDFTHFMMEAGNEYETQPHKLAQRQLVLNLGAIHSTSTTAVQALFDMISRPEYIEPLREEIRTQLKKHGGWTKSAVSSMVKMDSFLRESQRLHPPSLCK